MSGGVAITQERDGWSRVPHWLLGRVKPQAVVVYAALAVFADLPDGSRPRVRAVAERIGASESTVKRSIRELADVGAVVIEHRYFEGQQVASRYHLRVCTPAGGGSTSDTPGGSLVTGGVGSPVTYQESDSVQSDSLVTLAGPPTSARADADATFETFWSTYPRRDDRAPARRAWTKALRKADADVITAGAARYRDDPNRVGTFTKLGATWLNAEAWENGPLPSRNARPTTSDRIAGGAALAARLRQAEQPALEGPL